MNGEPGAIFPHTAFIGRGDIISQIETAVHATDTEKQVFYLEGTGGIGKTRLLAEIHQKIDQSSNSPTIVSTDVIDLYHVRYHQPVLLMDTIVNRLEKHVSAGQAQSTYFAGYKGERERYLSVQSAESTLSEARQQLEAAFLEDYAGVTRDRTILLLIDTFEKLHALIPGVEAFNFRQASRLENWLVRLIARLNNTVTLLAGRPRPRQATLLQETLGNRLQQLQVSPFSAEEIENYAQVVFVGIDYKAAGLIDQLLEITAGNPVRLSIALGLARIKDFDPALLPITYEEFLDPRYVDDIVRYLREVYPQLAYLLELTMYLRKGITADLLRQIDAGNSPVPDTVELTNHLDTFRQLAFVKVTVDPLINDRVITLHDEIQELLSGNLGTGNIPFFYDHAISYLEQQIHQASQRMQQGESDPVLRQQIQVAQVERLFYSMARDPLTGYQDYRELCFSAIQASDEDFDTQLQDEFARFYDTDTAWGQFYRILLTQEGGLSWERVILDEAIRWVYRRIQDESIADHYRAAIELAERVRQAYLPVTPTENTETRLDRCALEVAQLEAERFIYDKTPRGGEIIQNYDRVIAELTAIRDYLRTLPQPGKLQRIDSRYAELILATAYNDWGYFERTRYRLGSAIDNYREAIRLFKGLGPEARDLHATALNNLGFAQAQQGDVDDGLRAVQAALKIREALGVKYPLAMTLNTLARVLEMRGRVEEALGYAHEAQRLFTESGTVGRGQALCALTQGRIYRRLARRQYPRNRDVIYEKAIHAYTEAKAAFDRQQELQRRVETRLGLGAVYREWGADRKQRGADGRSQFDQALTYLAEAERWSAQIPGRTPERPDILANKAAVFIEQELFEDAQMTLESAKSEVPAQYWLFEAKDPTTSLEQDVRTYWVRLGEIELQYALRFFGQQQFEQGCISFAQMFAYLFQFYGEAPVPRTYNDIVQRELRRLEDIPLLNYLRTVTLQHIDAQLPSQIASQNSDIGSKVYVAMEKLFDDAIEDLELF